MNKGKKHQKVEEPVLTEEDKQNTDPFIRALAKKIRNINKKISDIQTLEKRDDLKPQQQQKINSKQSIIDERKKYEQFTRFYKSTLLQIPKEDRNNQQTQILSRVSNAIIAASHLKTASIFNNIQLTTSEKNILSNISKISTQNLSLNEQTKGLSGYLATYLEDQKLINKIEEIYAQQESASSSPDVEKPQQQQKKEKLQNQIQTKKQHDVKKQESKETKQTKPTESLVNNLKVSVQESQQKLHQDSINEVPNKPIPVQSKAQNEDTWIDDQPNQQSVQLSELNKNKQNLSDKKAQTKEQKQVEEKKHYQNDRYRKPYTQYKNNYRQKDGENGDSGYRERGPREGGYRQGGYRNNYRGPNRDKYNDKPKYQQKEERDQDNKSDTSLQESDQEYKRKRFNNKEIRELQDDGFHVIQKRLKPKDSREGEQNYQKQHGYKYKKVHGEN